MSDEGGDVSSGCTLTTATPPRPPAPHSPMTMKTDIECQMRLEHAIQTMSTTADAVTGAMNAMSNTVNGMTNSTNSVADSLDKLQTAVMELAHKVSVLPGADRHDPEVQDEDDETDSKRASEEEAWETVRDTIKDQDKETVDSWKDELNNLLVFAGLFSAVVTAFAVQSYTWLQLDPADASNMLLERISLQLSSLTVVTAAGVSSPFISLNSTVPALSLSEVQSSFFPVSYAVPVNILWVLSLTLSLLSALFAIAVQQWLRQLRVPPDMPIRKAIQLMTFRSDGLRTWQVPSIISLLPLLLQISVVFFLVGLFLLLQSLNVTVNTVFSVVALVGLIAFLMSTVLPLITIHCPYRSPLVPTVLIVLQWMSYPLSVAIIPVVISSGFILETCSELTGYDQLPVVQHLSTISEVLLRYAVSLGEHMFVEMSQFWVSREYRYISSRKEEEQANLEKPFLMQALLSISNQYFLKLHRTLSYSCANAPRLTAQDIVSHSLRAFHPGLGWNDILPRSDPQLDMLPDARRWLSTRHYRLLWHHLQQRNWTLHNVVSKEDEYDLAVLQEIDEAVSYNPQRYVKHLLRICTQQVSYSLISDVVPACRLLDTILKRRYVPSSSDIASILCLVSKVSDHLSHVPADDTPCQMLLVAVTIVLIAAHRAVSTSSTAQMLSSMKKLAPFFDQAITKTILKGLMYRYYDDRDIWANYPETMSAPKTVEALCQALANFRSLSKSSLQTLVPISSTLFDICADNDFAHQIEMKNARMHLQSLEAKLFFRGLHSIRIAAATGAAADFADMYTYMHRTDANVYEDTVVSSRTNPHEKEVPVPTLTPAVQSNCTQYVHGNE